MTTNDEKLAIYDSRLERVAAAAKAEVAANGYRSSDMARALKALDGEYWYEEYVQPSRPFCCHRITVEMDDGPLIQECRRMPHGPDKEHSYRAAYEPEPRHDDSGNDGKGTCGQDGCDG